MKTITVLSQPGCNPCSMVKQYLNESNIEFTSIDVTETPEVAAKYGVMSVPVTLLLGEDGKEISRSLGFKGNELNDIASQL
ncbi:glutaredoxin family protein [Bacillus sp. Marseille-P3800]|uniref:glutaredoxin family protein n=1 Tax=Bacillus sp. Marseille-P3800 TaxID=2014782 RepID=UPI000C0869B4|nr:thioredoxin family protein [Bacillus sp. Marseille-P3800]